MPPIQVDRRTLLGVGGAVACAVPLASSAAVLSGNGVPWSANTSSFPSATDLRAHYVYFTSDEAAFIEAAALRIVPADANGPSALEAGVPLFLDRQLAGDYGKGARLYMQGPFGKSTGTQGYQAKWPPAGFHRAAIKAIGDHLGQNGGTAFHKRSGADQDAFLKDLSGGKVDLGSDVDGKAYFTLLLQNVMEGYFSDPIYGGNRNLSAWKMIGFSGARYDQRAYVLSYGKPYPLPPVGIGGRPEWAVKG
ncbi:MAG TPA: gluconate 2-dehydrogenase subunit 3 family protein [Phenylobacterium sp.]|uniref:gluconate 2-dehydrogenase subunit 3 family protein n=1 Tax=Phenylobacterium sp. TaxID=1871053 RepID=UPI002D5B2DBF|nr:gluconate 2-dehydrogenase subunit 3 family protein [Phenylobacterium sp.]HZZ68681.1 gluconate 2-dehydrogenase subunit 3 family protein [Phenylobacterium sp.]